MEYIQTVLFQVPASLIDQASRAGGLLPEIDEHRAFLRQQPGFRDIRVTRSINNEGNVLIVIETRWNDDASLLRYETSEPNAGSIVRKHQNVIVPDSLQVLDMEALRTEGSWAPEEAAAAARERTLFPIVVPAGVLAFALLVVYGLSRIYLELSQDAAVGLAAAIAIGVLLSALYLAVNPRAPAWHIGGIVALAALALASGTIWALSEGEETAAGGETASASPGASPSPGAQAGEQTFTMGDNYFDSGGQRNPAITVAAGQEVTFTLDNKGAAVHNMHVGGASGYAQAFCKVGGAEPCSDPNMVNAGQTAKITITLSAGTYDYRCDFHPVDMKGKITAQ